MSYPRYVVTLRALPRDPLNREPHVALRQWLKIGLRGFGLRCERVEEVTVAPRHVAPGRAGMSTDSEAVVSGRTRQATPCTAETPHGVTQIYKPHASGPPVGVTRAAVKLSKGEANQR